MTEITTFEQWRDHEGFPVTSTQEPLWRKCWNDAQAAALKAHDAVVPVGRLNIRRFRGSDAMVNHDFDYCGDLPDGTYSLYATPPAQTADSGRVGEAVGIRRIAQLLRAASPDGEEWRSGNPNNPTVLNMRKLADKLEAALALQGQGETAQACTICGKGTPHHHLRGVQPPAQAKGATHCDNCGCTWLDDGLNPVGCPYCNPAHPADSGKVGNEQLRAAAIIYGSGYRHGHESTVEGGYTDVVHHDRETYWIDAVREMVDEDADLRAALAAQGQGEAVACPHHVRYPHPCRECEDGPIPDDFRPYPAHAEDKCFACGRAIGRLAQEHLVDTRDGQKVYVGSECYKKIKAAGTEGWQPPKGGPRLWLCAAASQPPAQEKGHE